MSESASQSILADSRDPLLRMRVYRLASELVEESWADIEELKMDGGTEKIAGQLYAALVPSQQISRKDTHTVPAVIAHASSNIH